MTKTRQLISWVERFILEARQLSWLALDPFNVRAALVVLQRRHGISTGLVSSLSSVSSSSDALCVTTETSSDALRGVERQPLI